MEGVGPDLSRRGLLRRAAWVGTAVASGACWAPVLAADARVRVVCDNDFGGDPDGLFQLAHHLLCPSVAIPLVIGSHLHADEAWDPAPGQAIRAAAKAQALVRRLGRDVPVLAGAPAALRSRGDRQVGPATAAIVAEAMRSDVRAPLFYAAGAGLTDLALAWLAEPRIGPRLRLVWIGGNEHPDLAAPPPGPAEAEYNLTIDPVAARILFNESDVEIWQVPRDAYRQMLFGMSELRDLASAGPLGRYLGGEVDRVVSLVANAPSGPPPAETYVLGDSPLVTLTALQSTFQPDPSSSRYVSKPTPYLDEDGRYRANPHGRPMRVYTAIDASLTFRDMVSKIRRWDAAHPAEPG